MPSEVWRSRHERLNGKRKNPLGRELLEMNWKQMVEIG